MRSLGEEPRMDGESGGGAPDGREVQGRSPRPMGSPRGGVMDEESGGGALDG